MDDACNARKGGRGSERARREGRRNGRRPSVPQGVDCRRPPSMPPSTSLRFRRAPPSRGIRTIGPVPASSASLAATMRRAPSPVPMIARRFAARNVAVVDRHDGIRQGAGRRGGCRPRPGRQADRAPRHLHAGRQKLRHAGLAHRGRGGRCPLPRWQQPGSRDHRQGDKGARPRDNDRLRRRIADVRVRRPRRRRDGGDTGRLSGRSTPFPGSRRRRRRVHGKGHRSAGYTLPALRGGAGLGGRGQKLPAVPTSTRSQRRCMAARSPRSSAPSLSTTRATSAIRATTGTSGRTATMPRRASETGAAVLGRAP